MLSVIYVEGKNLQPKNFYGGRKHVQEKNPDNRADASGGSLPVRHDCSGGRCAVYPVDAVGTVGCDRAVHPG